MIEIHPHILSQNGRKQFVILSYRDFQALQEALEEAGDIVALREARATDNPNESGLSLDEIRVSLGLDRRGPGKAPRKRRQ